MKRRVGVSRMKVALDSETKVTKIDKVIEVDCAAPLINDAFDCQSARYGRSFKE